MRVAWCLLHCACLWSLVFAPTSLLDELLNDIGTGSSSCARFGAIARAALQPVTASLRDAANHMSASRPGNAERDFQRWAESQIWRKLMPRTYEFLLHVKHSCFEETIEKTHSALLPHEVFGNLYNHAPELFKDLITGGPANLLRWWSDAARIGGSWYTNHPVIAAEPEPLRRVPFGLHGDDAGMHGQDQVLVLTWGSVALQKSTLDSRIVFTMIKCSSLGPGTMHNILNVLRWSLDALADGRYPDADHNGVPFTAASDKHRFMLAGRTIANGYRGCWAELRGDWKFLKEVLLLKEHYNNAQHICHLCRVVKFSDDPSQRYTNFKRNAPHRGTNLTSAAWHALYLGLAIVSPLLLIKGFDIRRVFFDIMHCMDLGIYQYMVPSVMKELTEVPGVFAGATIDDRYAAAYRAYRVWCKQRRVKSVIGKKFKKSVWVKKTKDSPYPHITQLTAKAAALRSMTYWLCTITQAHALTDPHSALRASMVASFVRADQICRTSGRFLTANEHRTLCVAIEAALVSYNALAVEACRDGKKLYKIVPKFHALTHIYDVPINPRRTACYQDEDMVGRMKRIYVRCHGSTAPRRALQRYCVLVCIRWWSKLRAIRCGC